MCAIFFRKIPQSRSPTGQFFLSSQDFGLGFTRGLIAARCLELDANAPLTHYMLGRAYVKLGDTGHAIAALEKGIHLAGRFLVMEGVLGYVHARAGARPEAERILGALRRRQLTQYESPIDLAYVCLGLGDADGTMALLEEAYRSHAI